MKPFHVFAAAVPLFLAMAPAMPAQVEPNVVADPLSLQHALQAKGYQALVSKDNDGDPMITSSSGGAKFLVLFFGCTNHEKCTNVEFYAGFEKTRMVVDDMNDWNRKKRFSRAYIDKDGDPCIEADLDLDVGGMSRALFEDNLDTWSSALGEFNTKVYAK